MPRNSCPFAGIVTVWLSPIGNGALLPTRATSAPAAASGTGADADLRPAFEPLALATSAASVLSRTSPVALNVNLSPWRTVIPAGVHDPVPGTATPVPSGTPAGDDDPLVATAAFGRDSTMRPISDEASSRSPDD